MPKDKIVAMILAGGYGNRLSILAQHRAKPAVPYGGFYRMIDFTLSNVMRSGIRYVGIMTQYKPYSLMDHISDGAAWGFVGRKRLAKILSPYVGGADSDWYAGTADAIYQNFSFLDRFSPEIVVVLSGDHIYSMDYSDMIEFHLEKNAALTIATQPVFWKEVGRFGVVQADENDRVYTFHEKKPDAPSNIGALGIYVFNRKILEKRLGEDARLDTSHDFGKDIIPRMLKNDLVYSYNFDGYWRDIGTVRAYWDSNMEILAPSSGGYLEDWNVRTNLSRLDLKNQVASKIGKSADIENSIISPGCIIEGKVTRSIISPGVRIKKGAKVKDSIIFHDTIVGENSVLSKVICDKNVLISDGCVIGTGANTPNETQPNLLNSGITLIGKTAQIPKDMQIGKNCLIYPEINEDKLTDRNVKSGTTIR